MKKIGIPGAQKLQIKNEINKCIKEIEESSLSCKDFLLYVLKGIVKSI